VQNYDWADEYFQKGLDMMDVHNYEKALEHFKDSEKLDSLNKEVYLQKGICYMHKKALDKAKKEFKNCLKVEPEDATAKKYLHMISSQEREQKTEITFLNKKRENK
jgi:tetratricopeptide (TPR) repeat protein